MYTLQQSKKFFFYDSAGRQRIFAGVEKAKLKTMNQAGAMVRTTARRSIRKARRMRIGELSDEQRTRHKLLLRINEQEGRQKPKLPFKSSNPGEPPRSKTGLLRKFLYYAFDSQTQSVVIGPAKLSGMAGNVPSVLEYGGTSEGIQIAARPYMRPAEEVVRSQYVRLWKDAMM